MSEKRYSPMMTIMASMASIEKEGRCNAGLAREYAALAKFFLPLPGQSIAIMENHQNETCNHHQTCQPSQCISGPAFIRIHRLAIGKQFSESKSRDQSSEVRIVIDPHAGKPKNKKDDHRSDQP